MMRLGRQLVVVFLLATGSSAAADGTQPVALAVAPHPTAAVGVVLLGGRAVCTGTLIAADLVLTSAHCLDGAGRAATDPSRIRFRTGAYPGVTPVEIGAARIVAHPLYPEPGEVSAIERRTGYDLALVRLGEDVPVAAALPLRPTRDLVVAPRLLIASFRGGQGVRARERTCPVIDATDRMIRMGCDVRPGESGAPVLQHGASGLALVGVLSARAEDGPQKLAIAAGSTRIGQLLAVMGPPIAKP